MPFVTAHLEILNHTVYCKSWAHLNYHDLCEDDLALHPVGLNSIESEIQPH